MAATLATVRDLEARFLHVDGSTDTVECRTARWEESGDEKLGVWGVSAKNPRSRLPGKVRAGDEVEFWLRKDQEPALQRVFVGVLAGKGRDFRSGKMSEYDVTGYGYEARLLDRHVTRYVTRKDAGALIHEVMTGNDIGITLTGVPNPFGVDVEHLLLDYADWLDFLTRVAAQAGADWHIDANRVLHFYERGTVNSGIAEDGSGGREFDFHEDASTVVNIIRGFGGTNKVKHAEQPTVGAYVRVTGTTSKSVRLLWPREEMPLVKVWARRVSGSASALEVRLESDSGGSPSGVPLTRGLVSADDLSTTGGWIAVFPPQHILGPGSYVHVIAQATTPEGVDLGVDNATDQNLAYEAYVGFPVATEVQDAASIAAYGKREGRPVRDADVTNNEELRLRLDVQLAKFKDPLHAGRFTATNPAYLTAALGSFITVNMPEVDTNLNAKQLVIRGREHRFSNQQYRLNVTLADGERERETGALLAELVRRLEYLESSRRGQGSNVLQLIQAADSLGLGDAATITATPTGTFQYDTAAYDFAEYADG